MTEFRSHGSEGSALDSRAERSIDRLSRLSIRGLRSLADVDLRLGPLTVLIGENGAGKSTLIEAIEILRKAAEPSFVQQLNEIHQGAPALLRQGHQEISFSLEISGNGPLLFYDFTIRHEGYRLVVTRESLRAALDGDASPTSYVQLFDRADGKGRLKNPPPSQKAEISTSELSLFVPGYADSARLGNSEIPEDFRRVLAVLRTSEVHVPVDVTARWAGQTLNRPSLVRQAVGLAPAKSVSLMGRNLPNAYQELKNQPRIPWAETLELIRLGLGDDVEDIVLPADQGGGQLGLGIKYRQFPDPVLSFWLSDGVLAYLAFIAVLRLSSSNGLLALDEPEAHLHPGLVDRVVGLLEGLSARRSVLVATHSDRILDSLRDPASTVVLCELDKNRATQLARPDSAALDQWLKTYRGLGDIRAAGHERSVFGDPVGGDG
jgi:predicted ATPase